MSDPALPIATALIAEFEGFRSEPYQDIAGVWTIGYGFTYNPDGSKVTPHTAPITQPDAFTRLEQMTDRVLISVRAMAPASITDNQAAAMTSFAFNEGTHALRISNLMSALNKGDIRTAAQAFMAWVYAGGHPSEGLMNRRKKESTLFLTPDSPSHSAPSPHEIAAGLVAERNSPSTPTESAKNEDHTPSEEITSDILNQQELNQIHGA